uniref:Family with sequence similarity 204 member A n=1 Tax=Sinocyclocheilus grahami TaxID=75366 RepID=A0A672LJB9_SINGR
MYSGHLPPGLSEADLSSEDDDADEGETAENTQGEQLSLQSDTESHSACVQVECNNTKTGLHNDAFGDDCLPGVSLDKWQKFKELQQAKVGTTNKAEMEKAPQEMEPEEKREEHWKELTQYFGINDRLKLPPCSRPPRMSGLEKSIESAIAEGDYGKAEELSDRLATRELAVKIAQAADCRDFARTKQEAEASQAARKRRKQIAWGFEAKKRWETKSNMGFM